MSRPARLFWPLAALLALTDCATKRIIEAGAPGEGVPRDVFGDALRFTLSYNQGAAFSSQFGPYERWLLIAIALVILAALGRLYRTSAQRGAMYVAGLALVTGGAVGNLVDRVRSARGVVDFIDVGIGGERFWVFNVADVGVTIGAMLVAWTLWRDDRREADGTALGAEPR
jgi:signal peptidase II